jgi:hypothetical protein
MPKRELTNWLTSYLEWTNKTEPPELFHMWTGISVLSTVLGRKVKFNRGHYTLYPNQYIILIAGSAKCRKSTAVGLGKQILTELLQTQKLKLSANKVTPQSLIHDLGREAQVTLPRTSSAVIEKGSEILLYAPELTTLLDTDSWSNGLITDLTDLYDCPDYWEKGTKGQGVDELYNVYINILGATTPKELGAVMPMQAIGSGFTSRVSFVFQRSPGIRIPHPEEYYDLPEKLELKEKLMRDLKKIYALQGEFTWHPKAKDTFTAWYGAMPDADDEKMEGYLGRKHDHAIKLAMIMSASMGDNLVVTDGMLRGAITLLDEIEKFMSGVYNLLATPNSIAGDIRWVVKTLKKAGGKMDRSTILRKAWTRFNSKTLDEIVTTMTESRMLTMELGNNNKRIYTLVEDEVVKSILFE